MKFILFCQNAYAFGILEPIMKVLKEKKYDYVWFVKKNIVNKFPFSDEKFTYNIRDLKKFKADVIFVPGNEVPHYLRGIKTQIFHGLAGEKKGHFKIRHYFDLYLTQGPYFTDEFNKKKQKIKNFEVIETGWPKLDIYSNDRKKYDVNKKELLKRYNADRIILYAPTFSPSLTSAPFLLEEIIELSKNKRNLILIKFHDLMSEDLIKKYQDFASQIDNVIYESERNIIKFLIISDILISDTSSVVYEFLLLDKPVLTFRSSSKNIQWDNSIEYVDLENKIEINLSVDPFKEQRKKVVESYHPYNDGNSAKRMVSAVEEYAAKNGIPEYRKLPLLRKFKIRKLFGS